MPISSHHNLLQARNNLKSMRLMINPIHRASYVVHVFVDDHAAPMLQSLPSGACVASPITARAMPLSTQRL